jgi:hypothetical protein
MDYYAQPLCAILSPPYCYLLLHISKPLAEIVFMGKIKLVLSCFCALMVLLQVFHLSNTHVHSSLPLSVSLQQMLSYIFLLHFFLSH